MTGGYLGVELAKSVDGAESVPWWRTDVGDDELALMAEAAAAKQFSMGACVSRLEREVERQLEVRHAVMTTSGSSALLLAMMAIGVGPGDRVVVPNRTFIATAHAAYLLGAKVDLVDCVPDRPLMDVTAVAELITPETKAVVPVHLNGRAVDMNALIEVARGFGVAVVEDAAQALYSRDAAGRFLGTIGDIGCFSLGMTKIISSGQGGVVVTNSDEIREKLVSVRNHGLGDLVDHTYAGFGFNLKPSDILASMGYGQMRRRDEKIQRCGEIYRMYEAALANSGIAMVPVDVDGGEVPLWVEVATERREDLIRHLSDHGIESRRFIPSLDTAPHLKQAGRQFPNSERFAATGMVLPCGPGLPLEYVERVIRAIDDWRRLPKA